MLNNYLHRFYPLQVLKLFAKTVYKPPRVVSIDLEPKALAEQTQHVLQAIHRANSNHGIVDAAAQRETFGFAIEKKPSSIPNAGIGVYLTGRCNKGQIVSFYPGTLFLPSEPLFFLSIANSYILKCVDGIYVDGKATGLSGKVYKSLYGRDNWPGAICTSDMTWMTDRPRNPLAIGQYVNNGSAQYGANVCYQEVDLPPSFPIELRQYLPNLYWNDTVDPFNQDTRVVTLVATRDIQDEELFSTYMDTI